MEIFPLALPQVVAVTAADTTLKPLWLQSTSGSTWSDLHAEKIIAVLTDEAKRICFNNLILSYG